jgi:hypothetical protein
MNETRRRITLDWPMPHPVVFVAIIAIFIAILSVVIRGARSATNERETGGAVGADALQRARLLYQRLTPGDVTPAFRVVGVPDEGQDASSQEQVMVSSAEEGTTARFLVTYDARTGRLRRLTWSPEPRRPAPSGQEDERLHEITDRRDAVLLARRFLRLTGVDEGGTHWTETHVARVAVTTTPAPTASVWHLQLTSAHWSMWAVIDAKTAEPTQILLLPNARDGR